MDYRIAPERPTGDELVRIVVEQLREAARFLSDSEVSREEAVHKARQRIKRSRAALRMLRAQAPELCAESDAVLRDLGRSLSPFRDLDVIHSTLQHMLHEHASGMRGKKVRAYVAELEARRKRNEHEHSRFLEAAAVAFAVTVDALGDKLRSANLSGFGPEGALSAARSSIVAARSAREEAAGSSDLSKFHDLRKRTQRALNQARLVALLDEEWTQRYETSLVKLASLLGKLQDFVIVAHHIATKEEDTRLAKGAAKLAKIVKHEQERLKKEVLDAATFL